MRAVKSEGTGPELAVRSVCRCLGLRYRLNYDLLPGKPDLVFLGRKAVVFVHGCFWHGHGCKRGSRVPATNTEYWLHKVARNEERDQNQIGLLLQEGWKVLVIWECETRLRGLPALQMRIAEFFDLQNKICGGTLRSTEASNNRPKVSKGTST